MSDCKKFLEIAWSYLEYAKVPISGRMRVANSCYLAHQAAEKALKAYIIFLGEDPPWKHDLELLLKRIKSFGIAIPPNVDSSIAILNPFNTVRYPGDEPEPDLSERKLSLDSADIIVQWIENCLAEPTT
jgi:HEPN domain-containing protein